MNRRLVPAALIWSLIFSAGLAPARSAEYWLADGDAFPGAIWHAFDTSAASLLHRRPPTTDPAFPTAIMKVGHVAAARDGALYFCSGLDGNVLALLDGRHEVLSFDHDGQIRDIATGDEAHTVYFSVVPTPQDGEPLADGQIFRRDIWAGVPSLVAVIHQADVGGNWWGTFTVREGVITIATLEPASRLFRITGDGAATEPVYPANPRRILGLEAAGDGYLIADGTGEVLRTTDFTSFEPALRTEANVTDVTTRD